MTDKEAIKKMKKIYSSQDQKFGKGKFYQSYEPMSIKGKRSTKTRIEKYKIGQFLNESDTVLDMGCNCGFFTLRLSEHVREISGFDNNKSMIDIALVLKNHIKNTNALFVVDDFANFQSTRKYDFINAAAIHKWARMPSKDFCDRVCSFLKPNGHLLFEGHDVNKDNEYKVVCRHLKKKGLQLKHSGNTKNGIRRDFSIWRMS